MPTLSQRLRKAALAVFPAAPLAILFSLPLVSIAALAEAIEPAAAEPTVESSVDSTAVAISPLLSAPAPGPATWQLVLLSRSTAIVDQPMTRAACTAAAQGFKGIVVRAACVDTDTGETLVF